jgi:hypothetical protein
MPVSAIRAATGFEQVGASASPHVLEDTNDTVELKLDFALSNRIRTLPTPKGTRRPTA